jgi:hypothetical protein
MLSNLVMLGLVITGVSLTRLLKSSRIMPDVEDFVVKTGMLGAVIGVALMQILMVFDHSQPIVFVGTLGTAYIITCMVNTLINDFHEYKTNKKDIVKKILIG